jgi:hypothetical protein
MLAAQLDERLAGGTTVVQSSKLMMKPAELASDIFVSMELPSSIGLVLVMVLLFVLRKRMIGSTRSFGSDIQDWISWIVGRSCTD